MQLKKGGTVIAPQVFFAVERACNVTFYGNLN
jgi:hypothetical protein